MFDPLYCPLDRPRKEHTDLCRREKTSGGGLTSLHACSDHRHADRLALTFAAGIGQIQDFLDSMEAWRMRGPTMGLVLLVAHTGD